MKSKFLADKTKLPPGRAAKLTVHKALRRKVEVRTNRLKRHSGEIVREIGASALLIVLIAIVAASLLIGCDRVVHSSLFSIRETAVRGCGEVTEKDVLSLAAIKPGANLFTVNKEAIAKRIRSNEWVKNVFVGREFPHRLVIWVEERKAAALIEKEHRLYLLDGNGEIFKKLEANEKADFPVLTGFFSENTLNGNLVGKSLALLSQLKTAEMPPGIGAVSEIHGNENFGFSVFTDKGLCLQLGFDGYETKLKSLTPVLKDMEQKNLKTGVLLIDLSNPEKINVQTRVALQPESSPHANDKPRFPAPKGKKLRI